MAAAAPEEEEEEEEVSADPEASEAGDEAAESLTNGRGLAPHLPEVARGREVSLAPGRDRGLAAPLAKRVRKLRIQGGCGFDLRICDFGDRYGGVNLEKKEIIEIVR